MHDDVTIASIGKLCTGCSSCVTVCPKNAISLVRDDEGFAYPVIDYAACVQCGICLKRCHLYNMPKTAGLSEMYAGFYKEKRVRCASSSGGAFAALAYHVVIQKSGVAFGAAIDAQGHVRHQAATDAGEIGALQKSKYVQSDMEGTYLEIERLLRCGRDVLFSGCPCQVAGLRSYLGKDYDSLLTVDLICHGVSSPGFWEAHIKRLLGSSTADSITFRRKDLAARTTFSVDIAGDGIRVKGRNAYDDAFLALFVTGSTLRECCYKCSYANRGRVGDITLGDCASSDCYRKFYPWEQLSTIAINTPKGKALWQQVEDEFCYRPIDPKKEAALNSQLASPSRRPELRNDVFRIVAQDGEDRASAMVSPPRTFRTYVKRVVKSCIPNPVRGRLIWLKAMVFGE